MSSALKKRVIQLENAISLMSLLASDLKYTMSPMEDVVLRLGSLSDTLPFVKVCAEHCKKGVAFPKAWRQAVTETPMGLGEEDLRILYHLGSVLGAVDLEGSLSEIDYARFVLNQRYEEAKARQKQLGGLYRTLGALAGIGIVIATF
ncbi:stage III sporulation protein AB [Hydrogenoanaerobacterium saccharovorans]|nr:stage III sporulation protein AB [Hydrogenoanaerobacterium saccharovorans]